MRLRNQWVASILIVLLTVAWWVGRGHSSPPHDGTAALSQSAAIPAVTRVRPTPSSAATPATSSPVVTGAPIEPDPGVTNHSLSSTRLLPAVRATTSGPHAFLQKNSDGTPVTWSPCVPIHYAVNSAQMPANGMEVLHAAIDRVSAATGLSFVQDPATHAMPSSNGANLDIAGDGTYLPVLITWTTKQEFPTLGEHAGVTSPLWRDTGGLATGHYREYFSGQVVLDATYYRSIAAQGWTGEEQAIIMHELGHLVGLAHVHVPSELMNERNVGLLHFGPGDLQGLAEAGNGRCAS